MGDSAPASGSSTPTHKHALTPIEKQRSQLSRLLKDPAKPAFIPPPPKEKTLRPAREMMKNVQGSSAGAGSGEFHVYKAARRREYERLRLLEEQAEAEQTKAEFERKRREAEEAAEAKTAKNRAKRQKKKLAQAKAKSGGSKNANEGSGEEGPQNDQSTAPLKKRRLINGQELVFKKPGEESDEDADEEEVGPKAPEVEVKEPEPQVPAAVVEHKITIIEDD